MFGVSVVDHFDSAHYLRGYHGKCEGLHGHRWKVEVTFSCSELNEIGLAIDFKEAKRLLRQVMGSLDHVCLNNVSPFDRINPSSENIARTIFDELAALVAKINPDAKVTIESVKVWESPDACVTYSGG